MSILSIDVGGTMIKYALMDKEANILSQGKAATPKQSQEAFFDALDCILQSFDHVEGIAMSLPGTIDATSGFIRQGGALPYNANTNMKELIQQRFHLPLQLENDAKCAAIAELRCGNMKDIQEGIVLTFGTGIGGCFIINGNIHHGRNFFAGEVSMMITKDIREYKEGAVWGSSKQGSVPGLIQRICDAKHVELVDGPVAFRWVEQGDEIAVAIFHEYCYQIVVQLFNLQLSIDPQRICIGGGISKNPLFVETLKHTMEAFYNRFPISVPRVEIMECKYHNNANVIGAYHHYMDQQSRFVNMHMENTHD